MILRVTLSLLLSLLHPTCLFCFFILVVMVGEQEVKKIWGFFLHCPNGRHHSGLHGANFLLSFVIFSFSFVFTFSCNYFILFYFCRTLWFSWQSSNTLVKFHIMMVILSSSNIFANVFQVFIVNICLFKNCVFILIVFMVFMFGAKCRISSSS